MVARVRLKSMKSDIFTDLLQLTTGLYTLGHVRASSKDTGNTDLQKSRLHEFCH